MIFQNTFDGVETADSGGAIDIQRAVAFVAGNRISGAQISDLGGRKRATAALNRGGGCPRREGEGMREGGTSGRPIHWPPGAETGVRRDGSEERLGWGASDEHRISGALSCELGGPARTWE